MGLAPALGIETLYKLKGFQGAQRDHLRDLLERSRIYFSSPDQFNDPYDVAPVIALGGDPADPAFLAEFDAREQQKLRSMGHSEEQIKQYRESNGVKVDLLADEARDDIRQKLLATTRILCLTAERCHPLQWAHYGDQHRGLCLHFRCTPGNLMGLARQVNYRADRTPIYIPLDRQSTDAIMERLIVVKADFWSYEQEYRIIAEPSVEWGGKLDGSFVEFHRNDLTGITLGMRMPAGDREALLDMIAKYRPGLPVWECLEDNERFWMKTRQLV